MTTARQQYRLSGQIDQAARSFFLSQGENRIGSADTNDLVIAVRGVSRHHACLRIGERRLEVENLESRNGTFVNGRRIRRTEVRPGDTLRLGPVELELDEIDAGDAVLAVDLETPGAAAALPLAADESTFSLLEMPSRPRGAQSDLPLVERLVGELAGRDPSPESVLAVFARELGARWACVVEWAGDKEPVLRAAHGQIEDISTDPGLLALVERARREAGRSAAGPGSFCLAAFSNEPVALAYAVLARPGAHPMAVVLAADPERENAMPLLRILARLVDWLQSPAQPQAGPAGEPSELALPHGYVAGRSAAISSVHQEMRAFAGSELPVLIEGETGVGKEYISRILHANSRRREGPLIAVNCAAIPADLLEAEMFGIAAGVATGVRERGGKFQTAEGGTLLLDEIGDMPLDLQAKLLRALEEKEIQRVGGRSLAIDVRVVAATNTDVLARVAEGRFRRDLYYRIAGCVLRVPPLRERLEDLPLFVERFLEESAAAAGKPIRGMTLKALQALAGDPWPGNLRELQHEIGRLVHLCPSGQAIDSTMLPDRFLGPGPEGGPGRAPAEAAAGGAATASLRLDDQVREAERRAILRALESAGGSQRKAARILGISRNTLAKKIHRLAITTDHG